MLTAGNFAHLPWVIRTALLSMLLAILLVLPMSVGRAQAPDPYESWGRVLAKFVNARGEVDFRGLARERADLDAFLEYVARTSPRATPEAFPTRDSRLAYYINAYNALSMFNVIDSDFPASLAGLAKVKFFGFKRFTVGGERMSLYTLENDYIRTLGDERVHFALNCMSVSCPRLPRTPFRAQTTGTQLEKEARDFFRDTRNLQIDHDRKVVHVSSILKFYTDDFLARMPSLSAYINLYAETQVPSDYRIEFVDYDWTVNAQRRDATGLRNIAPSTGAS